MMICPKCGSSQFKLFDDDYFACFACSRLIAIESLQGKNISDSNNQEDGDMSSKKPCIIEGCKSPIWKGDHCYKHHPETIEAKKNNPNSAENRSAKAPVKTIEDAVADHTELYKRDEAMQVAEIKSCDECGVIPCDCQENAEEVVPVSVPDNFGKVVNGDGDYVSFGVDEFVYLAIDEAMEAKKREWLVDLSGVSPLAAVGRLAGMVKAIQALGY